jgi:hypothetical protein
MLLSNLAHSLRFAAVAALLAASSASAQKPGPVKYKGPATKAEISAGDLMTRLYIYADDSMLGRQVGTENNIRATAYIEREVRRLGLVPAGDSGTYFQWVPVYRREFDKASVLTVGNTTLAAGVDFNGAAMGTRTGNVIYGGVLGDSLNPIPTEAIAGKMVVLRVVPGLRPNMTVWGGATALLLVGGDQLPAISARMSQTENPAAVLGQPASTAFPLQVNLTAAGAAKIFGKPLADVAKGTDAGPGSVDMRFAAAPAPARNVVAILPGSDPALKSQYVLVGAHNDHVGFNNRPVDHDSMKAFNDVFLLQGAESRPSPDQLKDAALWAKVNAKIAAARAINPPRADSIYNGADDDGSGSVTVLEIAEAFAAGKLKPKRSILFIWQTGEESGMWGSGWFADHPTVPRDSIVGAINMDMVGRGFATDVTGTTKEGAFMYGGPGYLQLVGSRRLSVEFGDLVEAVNTEKKLGFKFDYNIDADGHPQNIYCRSDHWSYAKYGIPVVFFTTGGHADYHQLTDEPQYINYPHMADVSKLGLEVAMKVANLDHRVKIDKAGPFDPKARCRQ